MKSGRKAKTRRTTSAEPGARGGARAGAGRPALAAPLGEVAARTTVMLYPSDRERLLALGGGNLSAGLRAALRVLKD